MSLRSLIAAGTLLWACSVELAPLDLQSSSGGGAAGQPGGAAGAIASGGAAGTTSAGAGGGGGIAGGGGMAGGGGTQSGGAGGAPDASLGGASGSAGAGGNDAGPGALIGKLSVGYYWATTEAEFPGTKDTNLYTSGCVLIATVTASFSVSLKSIGTGRLDDGRVLAYDGACSCPTTPCYVVCDAAHPWGYGVQNAALVPFRSVAVDKTQIPYGTSLYAPALAGMTMPGAAPWGGFVHDGCLHADDAGNNGYVNLFTALKADYTALSAQLASSIDVYAGGTLCP